MQKDYKYWFLDKWDGSKRTFENLSQARNGAKKQYGMSVAIYDRYGNLKELAPASGFTPA